MQPYSKWSDDDFLMLRAYDRHVGELSSSSGHPLWVTRNVDPSIAFRVEEQMDYADRALGEWDEKNSGKNKKKGMARFAVPIDEDGLPLEYGGLTRHRYQVAAIQEQQDLEDGIDVERDRPEGGYNPADYGDGVTDPA